MRSCRWFDSSRLLAGVVLLVSLGLCVTHSVVEAEEARGHLTINIHDGIPYVPIPGVDQYKVVGNFMTWVDTWDEGFILERIWFYHGGNYADSGIPYAVHLIRRLQVDDGEWFSQVLTFERSTTCNDCWETVEVGLWDSGGSDEQNTFGVFIQPLAGGGAPGPQPRVWRDCCTNHEHLAALLRLDRGPRSGQAIVARDRDSYSLIGYYSDIGAGEVLLGMEIESDVIVATEPSSFSAVKSLY